MRSVEEARELARAAAAEGVTAIAATPHVRDDYPTRAARMESGVEELRRDFAANRIAVEVLHGGEIDLDRLAALDDDEVSRFTLAQTGRYLLLEFPDRGWPMALEPAVHGLARRRIVTVLAHPERNHEVQAHPERLELLLGAGAIVQVTSGSIDGRLGRSSQAAAKRLVQLGLAHLVAGDAHGPHIRDAGLAAAARAVGDDALARWLTEDVPAAIVAGEPIPGRPGTRGRRGLFRR